MKTFRIFINSASRTSGTLTNCTIPVNQSLFPKFENPELRIETMYIENGALQNQTVVNVAIPNIMPRNMQALTSTPAQSSIIRSFNSLTFDEETTKYSKGVPIDGTNMMNSGFIQVQLLDPSGQPYGVNNGNHMWFMTLVIMEK